MEATIRTRRIPEHTAMNPALVGALKDLGITAKGEGSILDVYGSRDDLLEAHYKGLYTLDRNSMGAIRKLDHDRKAGPYRARLAPMPIDPNQEPPGGPSVG